MEIINKYLKENEGLFAIIGFLVTIFALLPILITFIFGDNWAQLFVLSKYGYFIFIFCLIISYIVGILLIVVSSYIYVDFYSNKIKTNPDSPKKYVQLGIFALIPACLLILSIVIMSIWSLINNYFIFLPNFLILILYFVLIFCCSILLVIHAITNKYISHDVYIHLIIQIISILILILIFSLVPPMVLPTLYSTNNEIIKYYDNKEKIELNYTLGYLKENTLNFGPETLSLSYLLNESDPQNQIPKIQRFFLQCKWSTNYGHFLIYDKINFTLENKDQNFVYNYCHNCPPQIFWTYDYSDFNNSKPDVHIMMTIQDKNSKHALGNSELTFKWENNTLLYKIL